MSLSQLASKPLRTVVVAAVARGVGTPFRQLMPQLPSCCPLMGVSVTPTATRSFRSSCIVLEQSRDGDDDDNTINVDELLVEDPSRYVYSVTKERLKRDPVLLTYFRDNYPQAWKDLAEGGGRDKDYAMDQLLFDAEEPTNNKKKKKKEYQDNYLTRVRNVSYAQNIRPLHTFLRSALTEEGTRASRRLRMKGYIPGMINGSDPFRMIGNEQIFVQTPWNALQRELDRYHRNFESRVYDLTVYKSQEECDSGEGQVHRVIPHNVNRHPVASTVYCVNYCRFHAERPIMLPFKPINQEESSALKREGYIVPIQRKIECLIEGGVDIPEFLELECTGLTMRQAIRLDRISLPPGVRVTNRVAQRGDDYIIGVIFGKSRDALLEEEEEAKAAEAAKA